jgi:uncharacterized integral membrane protein
MLALISAVVLAGAFALFATQNTGSVQINFGRYVLPNIPTYAAILIPLIIGLLASYFLHIMYYLSLKLTISEQEDELKKLKMENVDLAKDLHKLELENTKLKNKNGKPVDEDSI